MMQLPWRLAAATLIGLAVSRNVAAFNFQETPLGVSCPYFDVALMMGWPAGKPDWFDAQGVPGGKLAYDSQRVQAAGGSRVTRWNVTALFRQWATAAVPNEGLVIAATGTPGGGAQFHARESADIDMRPSLKVTHPDGRSELLAAAADAVLDCSTHAGLGDQPVLSIGANTPAIMRFDLSRLRLGSALQAKAAELILVRTAATPWSLGSLAVFRLNTPFTLAAAVQPSGIAAAYRGDRGLENHADVMFVERFAGAAVDARWTRGDPRALYTIQGNISNGAVASPARSLRATIRRRQNLGLDLRFDFKRQLGKEPEEIYLRYYLKLDRTWIDAPDAGKLPGLSGTYGRAGWGGRPWDGSQGWSARGAFIKAPPVGHVMRGRLALGSYVYHSKSTNGYGEVMAWSGGQGGAQLQIERWYCIEQFLKLNTPQREDGVLRAWIDGRQVFERKDLRLRDTVSLKIESAWMNLYLGGQQVALQDMSLNIAQVVIASRYIGPMAP